MAQRDQAAETSALAGLRVIDFGQYIAGPLAAMLLADNGAKVIRIDPPGGPRWKTPANAVLQRGKRSIVLDLKQPADLETARRLIASVDVVIENFRPGVMDRLGVGAKAMTEADPRLIYCSLPGFGEDDPRAGLEGWEGVVAAAAGLYRRAMFGVPSEDPFFSPVPFSSDYAAVMGAHAVMAAVIGRHKSGRGQRIEVPLFDAAYQVMGFGLQQVGDTPNGDRRPPRNKAFVEVFRCADGEYVYFTPPQAGHARFIAEVMPPEVGELINKLDPESEARMREILKDFWAQRPAKEWEPIGQAVGAGIALIQGTEDWLRDPHAHDTGGVLAIKDPEYGDTLQMGNMVSMDRTPPRPSPRHGLDSDHRAIVAELAAPRDPGRVTPPQQGPLPKPLEGFRVIDTTQVLAGPTSARILAEYGADVIKINNPKVNNTNAMTPSVNSGKRTILLDLKAEEGRDLMHRMIRSADVFHQNFAIGVADRLGIGEAEVRALRPDIIYSSVNVHAEGGVRSNYRGHEQLGQAVTGMARIYSEADGPSDAGWPVNDHCTGHLAAFATLVALFHRLNTGEGQHIRASLSGTCTFLLAPFMISYAGSHIHIPAGGPQLRGWGPLDRLYEVSDGWIYLAAVRPGDQARLAKAEGLQGVESLAERELEAELVKRFKAGSRAEWTRRLAAAGVAAHRHATWVESSDDPLVRQRGLTVVRDHPGIGKVRRVAAAARLYGTPVGDVMPAPKAGWHTQEVLEEFGLGDRFEPWSAEGVVSGPG